MQWICSRLHWRLTTTTNCDAADQWRDRSISLINSPPSILQFDIWEIWRWKCQSGSDETSLGQDHQMSVFRRREELDEEVSFSWYFCYHSAHCCMLLILFCFFTYIARYIDRNAHDSDGAVCCLTHAACLFTHVPRYLIQISQTEFGNQMRSLAL